MGSHSFRYIERGGLLLTLRGTWRESSIDRAGGQTAIALQSARKADTQRIFRRAERAAEKILLRGAQRPPEADGELERPEAVAEDVATVKTRSSGMLSTNVCGTKVAVSPASVNARHAG